VTSAVVVDDGSPVTLGGLTLTERAVLMAHRSSLRPIRVWGATTFARASVARLQTRGVQVGLLSPASPPLEGIDNSEHVVVVGPNVLFGPGVLADLAGTAIRADGAATGVFDEAGSPLLLCVPPGVSAVRTCRSLEAMVASLSTQVPVHASRPAPVFCRRVGRADATRSVERDYTRHLNGAGEAYFTKRIRKFSVPLTSWLVRLGARPTHVTLGGLALAVASAWFIAQGSYGAGVLGGLLYYTSMIFDCSDGEVARLTLRDDPFGAWLETIVDYLTYFLVLAALVVASQERPGAEAYRAAAAVALVGSIVVAAVAGYLRHRVAAADPGQFDDAAALALASATRFHRFARWGRQWIKRSTVAHLIVALAAINQLPALIYLWAFGATVASIVILVVEPFVVRKVFVAPAAGPHADGDR
jgi:phosphatidylglycerophosphate synthase